MYQKKSKIIERIQSYHKDVAEIYEKLIEKVNDQSLKPLISRLYELEKSREEYLEKHKKVALALDFYLDFPCDKLKAQITDCIRDMDKGANLTKSELLQMELHFDGCLTKIYNILASEAQLSETVNNVFYYMLKKTKKEEQLMAELMHN